MKKISQIVSNVICRNIKKEMDNACILLGYQPIVPDSAKKFKNRKNK